MNKTLRNAIKMSKYSGHNFKYHPPNCPECGAYEWTRFEEPWPEQLTHMYDKFWRPLEPDGFFVKPLIEQSAYVLKKNRNKDIAVIDICGNCGLVVS